MSHLYVNTLVMHSSFLFPLLLLLPIFCVGARPDLVGATSALIFSAISCRVPQ